MTLAPFSNRGLASHLIGRAVLKAAAQLLHEHAIPVMPLKGIWLQHFVYADPSERPITDVDVLVPDSRYLQAIAVLRAAGWELRGSNVSEAALRAPGFPLPLDLHRRLFTRAAFRMPSEALFARGTADRGTYEIEVVLPDPLDVFAHLIGHFVKRRGGREQSRHELQDLPHLAARFDLDPSAAARHLERCGLARASRYALPCVPEVQASRDRCREILQELRPDPIGQVLASGMLKLRARVSAGSALAILPGFLLDRSLPRAVISGALRAIDRRHDLEIEASRG